MLQKIKSYLYSKNNDNKKSNYILFEIDKNNDIHIKIDVQNLSVDSSDKFGFLLFLMNEGYYVQTFLDILSDLAKRNYQYGQFVQKTINIWSNKLSQSDESEHRALISTKQDPLIRPSQFNTSSNK